MTSFNFPDDLLYHETHFWLRPAEAAGEYHLGITQYAQKQLGKILFVDLPVAGTKVTQGETFGAVESSKVVFDLHSPISGAILEPNASLKKSVQLINEDCYGQGWLLKLRLEPSDTAQLLTSEAYTAYLSGKGQKA
ncbi:MAG: glycine cleavage system protein H [Proteobacteria bacterium]|nr:glycine cleavage system protein H [Pseudomonadota bacterium]